MKDVSCVSIVSLVVAVGALPGCLHDNSSPPPLLDGGGTGDSAVTDSGPAKDAAVAQDASKADAGGDAAMATSAGARGIYVSNAGTDSVLVFPLDAGGNAAPLRVLMGATTGLSLPIGVAVDANGQLYVANRTGAGVTVYASSANGDEAPAKTLTAATMLSSQGVALTPAGDVYVSTCPGCGMSGGGNSGVFHFPSGATASDRTLGGATNANTLFIDPASIALDPAGNLYVGNAFGGSLELFSDSAVGDVAPSAFATPGAGANVQSIAYGAGTVFVAVPGTGILEYAIPLTADAGPSSTIPAAAVSMQYPAGMFIDSRGATPVLYLVDYSGDAIYIVPTTGSAGAWVAGAGTTISGAATLLNQPLDITVVF